MYWELVEQHYWCCSVSMQLLHSMLLLHCCTAAPYCCTTALLHSMLQELMVAAMVAAPRRGFESMHCSAKGKLLRAAAGKQVSICITLAYAGTCHVEAVVGYLPEAAAAAATPAASG
jgi:hypothetical protein